MSLPTTPFDENLKKLMRLFDLTLEQKQEAETDLCNIRSEIRDCLMFLNYAYGTLGEAYHGEVTRDRLVRATSKLRKVIEKMEIIANGN